MRRRQSVFVAPLLLVALSGCTSHPSGGVAPASSISTTTAASGTAPSTTMLTAPPLMPSSGTGAYGYVTAGPTCPVEKQGQPCVPRPVLAAIDARNESGVTVASTQSDSSGRYALALSAGRYVLMVVTPSGWPRCSDMSVAVKPGSATRADITCDTGIR
jgi:hypothetical protein